MGVKDWFRTHKSANFISLLFVSGLILLGIGLVIPQTPRHLNFVAILILQLSGACITTAILTIFFNFEDVKNYMAKTISHMFLKGSVVRSLSKVSQTDIDKEIILDNSRGKISTIESSLYNDLTELRELALGDFFMINYNISKSLYDYRENEKLLIHRTFTSYRIESNHMSSSTVIFPLKINYQMEVPKDYQLSKENFIRKFKINIGNEVYSMDDLSVEKIENGPVCTFSLKFEKEVIVQKFIDVKMELETLSLKSTNNEIFIMRHPAKGLNISLHYKEGLAYNACFFKSIRQVSDISALQRERDFMDNGIALGTNDWVLPGYGAVFAWYLKN